MDLVISWDKPEVNCIVFRSQVKGPMKVRQNTNIIEPQ